VPFSTLKIPEYMACARPVASVPSGRIKRIIEDGISGFLFPNNISSWENFLGSLPSRNELFSMGRIAELNVKTISWEKTAEQYLKVCKEVAIRN
jgi:glycosyltransferase involved in cell wall biosynthesis